MSTIKLTDFGDPSNDIDFDISGKKLFLKSHDTLMDLIVYTENKRLALLSKYDKLLKTIDNIGSESNTSKLLTNFSKHSEEIEQDRKNADTDMRSLFIDFFDSVFLNQNGDEVEAGKLIAKTVVTTTALSTFFEKIVTLVKQQDVNIQSKMDKATGDAFKAAGIALVGDNHEANEDTE